MTPQKKATVVSTITASILVIFKIVVAIMSGSVAVLASAIDSVLDMFISMFNFFAINKSEEAPDEKYHYGKAKIQALAALAEGIIISISGLYIIYASFNKIITGNTTEHVTPAIFVMIISIVITYFLVAYLLKIAKDTDNIVIKADALHYKTDLLSNFAVLGALVVVHFSGLDFIDAIVGFGIGAFIIYSAFDILKEAVETLLDIALDDEIVDSIEKIIDSSEELTSYHWLKTRTDGSTNYVEFHMVLWPNIALLEAHRIADLIEDQIMKLDDNKNWVITPHFDPYDDEEINEASLNGRPYVRLKLNHQ